MPTTSTPLRYPGGKSSILPMMVKILEQNNLIGCIYAEPYAGGCGLALNLLMKGYVKKIYLNDYDYSIWGFWHSVLEYPEELIEKISNAKVTVEEWRKQKSIQERPEKHGILELGFSTLFLNRTNRSGVINAGVIGGLSQDGKYKIDARFGKEGLINKIKRIQEYKDCIKLYNLDAIDFLNRNDRYLQKNGLFCIDPPYYNKGHTLYTNFYNHEDHVELSNRISKLKSRWVLTYDNAQEIKAMYSNKQQYLFNLNYSAANKRKGTELLITNKKIKLNSENTFVGMLSSN